MKTINIMLKLYGPVADLAFEQKAACALTNVKFLNQ